MTEFRKEVPNNDPAYWHPLVVARWGILQPALERALRCRVRAAEGYRPDERQQWLYAQGRTAAQLKAKGIDPLFARTGPIITNAWSAKTSAHGFTLLPPYTGEQPTEELPAACALDLDVLGADGKPWTKDDPWDEFVVLTSDGGLLASIGLVHFHAVGKAVWDKPHIQLIEWSDVTHNLLV